MGWFDTVLGQIDILRGRFDVFEIEREADRLEYLDVLDAVRAEELNRLHGSSALETAAFADQAVSDRLFAIRDSSKGEIVGGIRKTPAEELAAFEGSRAEYNLGVMPSEIRQRTGMLSRFAISKDYRKSSAALALFYFLYQDGLERGDLASLLSCEPGLYPGYLRLGFRPIGHVHAGASGGFRVPMVLIVHDLAHLLSCRSPLAGKLRAWHGHKPEEAVAWFQRLEAEQGPIDPGVAFHSTEEDRGIFAQLTEGLSEHGRQELLHHAIEIKCRPGDLVLRTGDGGRFMGFVLDGVVEARIDGRVVRTMPRGELFGEAAVALDSKRSADVVAVAEHTRVLTLSRSSINRVNRDSDRAQLWQNIAKVLAMRIERASE